MRAMILAAGRGERLMPITDLLPKPALGVLGIPLVVHALHWLRRHGVERAVMNLHHRPQTLAEQLVPHLGELTPEMHYSFEAKLLGSGGGLANARHFFENETTVVVANSDAIHDIDLTAALEAHAGSDDAATLVCLPRREGYGAVELDEAGKILSLSGAPEVDAGRVARTVTFSGIHLIDARELAGLRAAEPWNLRDLYRTWAADGRIGSYPHEGFWWEFGDPASFLEGCLRILALEEDERRALVHTDPVLVQDGTRVARSPGAGVDDSAELCGRVALGFATRVSRACRVEDSVLLSESWIGPGTSLRRVLVAPHTEIPAGKTFEDCILMRDTGNHDYHRAGLERRDGILIRSFESA